MLFEDHTLYIMIRFLLTLCGTFGMASSTTRFNRNYKRSIVLFCIYLLYATISSYFVICLLGYFKFLRIFLFTITIPALIMMYFISEEPLPRLIFTRVTQVLFSIYVAGSATLLNNLLHGNMLSSLLLLLLLYALVISMEFLFLRKNFMYIADTIKEGWGILSLIPCVLIILEFLIGIYPTHYTDNPTSVVLSYLLLIFILILYTVIFLYLRQLYNHQMSERNMEILQLQVRNIRMENEAIEVLEEQARIIRHDTRHMLSVIASLAQRQDAQAILNYIDRSAKEDAIPKPSYFCNDQLLNTTFSSYFIHAKNLGYLLETSLSIPDTLPIDSAELAICFANALECVLRLSSSISKKEWSLPEKKIIVRCIDQPKLMFEVSGPCIDNPSFHKSKFRQTKDAGLNVCINSIQEFCRRHDAVSSFTSQNSRFTVKIAL